MRELEDAKKAADKRGVQTHYQNTSIGPIESESYSETRWIAQELRALRLTIEALAVSVEKIANPAHEVRFTREKI